MNRPILGVRLQYEQDIVTARQRARQLARLLGFDVQEQTRLATAVSEISRNAYQYGGGGKVEFLLEGRTAPQLFIARVTDTGSGIDNLEQILAGRYRSSTGMGVGITGARRLVDQFEIESTADAGTTVLLKKLMPARAPFVTAERLGAILDALSRERPSTPLEEVQQQNQELLRALDELRVRQDELLRLNVELEDTNRGVVALLAELDEKADHLRRADEMKSKFLSNMSHEFRTPLNAIRGLSRLLLDKVDGDLAAEQEKQIGLIQRAAHELTQLVDDLLDLAKVEAGKIEVHPTEFEVTKLFGALRGMLRPMLLETQVALVFEEPRNVPPMETDEGKVSQILRNFLSNALKFTEHGEVRVSASLAPEGDAVIFSVADTGIGIAPQDQARIFEEFSQLDNPIQKRVKGTGLGLPLSKRLAELLGGHLAVTSAVGKGSTFVARIPIVYQPPAGTVEAVDTVGDLDPTRKPVLVVEDQPDVAMVYERAMRDSGFQMVRASGLKAARQMLSQFQPAAIVLDIVLRGEDTWALLAELKGDEITRRVPVIMATILDDERKARALGADDYLQKPFERDVLLRKLQTLTHRSAQKRVLLVDDEETSRYLLRRLIAGAECAVLEAAGGIEGLRLAREERPDAILLDLMMPDASGLDVLDQLKADPITRPIPVIVITSKMLSDEDRRRLATKATAVLSKDISASGEAGRALVREALAQAGVAVAA